METKVNCPYCGKEINNDVEQCEFCKEFFKEPCVVGIKETSVVKFFVFEVLTFGLYSLIWTTFNNACIKKFANTQDYRKFISFYLIYFVAILGLWFVNIPLFLILRKISGLFLSYRMLRIFEKYSFKKYNSKIYHNEYGWFFFDIAYVVYFLEMFSERVKMPTKKYYLDVKRAVFYSSVALLTLFVISIVGLLFTFLALKV